MYYLENEHLKVSAKPEGAELTSVYDKKHEREMLWTGDPAVWKRHSPVLFPFVGRCRDYTYRYKGKPYPMTQHGFCQDALFEVERAGKEEITFLLTDNEERYRVYPFHFTFRVIYRLEEAVLRTIYMVQNEDTDEAMYFSIGGHPGFLYDGDVEEQEIVFSQKEDMDRVTLGETMYFSRDLDKNFVTDGSPIAIDAHTYDHDALVFHNFISDAVCVRNKRTGRGVKVGLGKFPYVGFWSMPGVPYTCVEPWFGLADYEDFEGELPEKDGILKLDPLAVFQASFTISAL